MTSKRDRPHPARAAGSVVIAAALAFNVSACSGELDTECTGGAYEVECHPVYRPPSTTTASVSPVAAPTPTGSCPSDWAEAWKRMHARTWDSACPLPSPLGTVLPAPSG
ncbi:hypothetical protein GCM10010394_48860 [Streptomyces crystallinus]|uniref:Lipoprotein n=1 Tax=Streptomyces crystallinus TaxID=68191 RepID=A0ABP3RMB0_9ACTN